EAATGLALIAQGWSHFLDRWPQGPIVLLPLAPLIAIEEVRVYGDDDEAAIIDPAHYYADTLARPARLVLRPDRVWPPSGRGGNDLGRDRGLERSRDRGERCREGRNHPSHHHPPSRRCGSGQALEVLCAGLRGRERRRSRRQPPPARVPLHREGSGVIASL